MVIDTHVAAVAIALLGSGLPLSETLFIGWFGPRGIGSVVLGLLVIEQGAIHQDAVIKQAVVIVVTVSLVVHSLTAPVGIRLQARQ
jgi:sodium/hydrogen antiporter